MLFNLFQIYTYGRLMFLSSINEIIRLFVKVMSNIYFKITIRKKWRSQNFDFLNLKNSSPGQFLGSY